MPGLASKTHVRTPGMNLRPTLIVALTARVLLVTACADFLWIHSLNRRTCGDHNGRKQTSSKRRQCIEHDCSNRGDDCGHHRLEGGTVYGGGSTSVSCEQASEGASAEG